MLGFCVETEGLVRGVEGPSIVQVMDEPVSTGDPSEGPLWGSSLSRRLRIPPQPYLPHQGERRSSEQGSQMEPPEPVWEPGPHTTLWMQAFHLE